MREAHRGRQQAVLSHPLVRGLGAILLSGILVAGAVLVPVVGVARVVATLPDPTEPAQPPALDRPPTVSVITDAGDAPIAWLFDQYRVPAAYEDLPVHLQNAVIAIEDQRFLSHDGVDWRGVGRAVLANLLRGGDPFEGQGASTITMQYVKIQRAYVEADAADEREAAVATTVQRKLLDTRQALALEQELSKQEILTRYLNTVYFGNGAYGIGAAARTYFGVPPAELTLPQAALLAGLIRAPNDYEPVGAPASALARRDQVLTAMAEIGAITPARAEEATAAPLGVVSPLQRPGDGCVSARPGTGFFCRYLLDHLAAAGLDTEELRAGGYTIRSTLDLRVTDAARRAAAARVPVEGNEGIANAVAVVQPGLERHRVMALVANRELGNDPATGQSAYLLPSAPVPYGAGSIYKIFTATAALERGVGMQTELPSPQEYTSEVFLDDGEPYEVTGGTGEDITLGQALAVSPNTTFVALLDRLGSVGPAVDAAQRLGLRQSLAQPAAAHATIADEVRAAQSASFTLGPFPTSPLDLANVGATLVSDGIWCPPSPVDAVTDRHGRPVPIEEPPCERAVPSGVAATLVDALTQGPVSGTSAAAASAAGWDRPMMGKTGTTQHSLSAGYLGATPHLSGAVMTWSDGSPPRPVCVDPPRLCADGDLFGGTIPAATWFAAMAAAHEDLDLPVVGFPGPDPRYVEGDPPDGEG